MSCHEGAGNEPSLLQEQQVLLTTEAALQLLLIVSAFVQLSFSTRQTGQQQAFSMQPAVRMPAHKRSRKGEVTFTELTPRGPLISKDQSNNNRMTIVTLTWTVHVKLLPNISNFTHFTKAQSDTLLQKNSS